jgi:hypothetical protein
MLDLQKPRKVKDISPEAWDEAWKLALQEKIKIGQAIDKMILEYRTFKLMELEHKTLKSMEAELIKNRKIAQDKRTTKWYKIFA